MADGDYFGAKADPNYGYSPYSGQLHYGNHSIDFEFTPDAGEGNPLTIETVEWMINNSHPEEIAVLGDHWQNMITRLNQYKTFLRDESKQLEAESWKSPKAREMFLQKGPGEALAYLDVWIDAATTNLTAIRALEKVAADSRAKIAQLMNEYRAALHNAQHVDLKGQLSEWFDTSRALNTTWGDAKKYQIQQQVGEVEKHFNGRAQELAALTAKAYSDWSKTLFSGVGPPYKPMDAVLNQPGHPPLLAPPNLPGGGAPPPPPPLPPAVPPPPPPSGANPKPPTAPGGDLPPDPSQGTQGNPPPAPGALPAPPGQLPGGMPGGVPGGLPLFPGGLSNRGLTPPSLRPGLGAQRPALPQSPGTSLPNPGQLTRNAFNRPGQPPGLGQPPGRTLRRGGQSTGKPGSLPPGRPGDRRRGEQDREHGTRLPGGTEEAFGHPPNSMPPVLKNPSTDRQRRRPGSTEELRPTAHTSGDAYRPEGTAPPVLNRPMQPGIPPAQPSRRRQTPGQRQTTGPAWGDFFGAEQARAAASAPVLGPPLPPPTGSQVSGLEEVPEALRSRAAARAAAAQQGRPGTVAPELSKRRVTGEPAPAQRDEDEDLSGVVTDEQAFEVQTPGGGVVTSQRDQPVYEPEIKRVLGSS
ncbi:hypothetical protein ACWT_1459 [Actinoplanes sp. SE50]|uniref:hypothetical protein n=1 Tax=unclassified Actinoplanes TaxID=2626549 RepID=UPI00023EC3F5|nr:MULTISPECIES: hypothetical protein [unclassified Actinoplanes]AEV82477.1 hypothetical protein ACPL_1580 [Actinoplanes sp. SE50/110]ATO80874.1 hypothetical protein ACWT_1459 [Actinoplanes sp. SE50]SLL98281.1 hypothetical protein ACSP50_1507 [Actinoplanes sp. SE50/110]